MKITAIIKIALIISIIITDIHSITNKNSKKKLLIYNKQFLKYKEIDIFAVSFFSYSFLKFSQNKKAYSETLQKESNNALEKNEVIESVSFSLAKELKTNDFYVANSKDFKSAEYVKILPVKKPISDGVIETIDEVKCLFINL